MKLRTESFLGKASHMDRGVKKCVSQDMAVDNHHESGSMRWVVVVLGAGLLFSATCCLLYPYVLKWYTSSISVSGLGEYGDIYGGLNTFFTGAAFVGLLVTIWLQRKEMQSTRKEFEEQTVIMTRQTLDEVMFEYLKYMDGLLNKGELSGPFMSMAFSAVGAMKRHGADAGTIYCDHVNCMREILVECSAWRRIINSWFRRVDNSSADCGVKEEYKYNFWYLLPKEERAFAFLQCALFYGRHKADWNEMYTLFAHTDAIADFFGLHQYTDEDFTVLVNLLAEETGTFSVKLADSRIKQIVDECRGRVRPLIKCPSREHLAKEAE